ncbi:Clp protease ClpP [Paenibacillus rhizophilus]|uniref:ATP-dependent Clp protease proteolytic subunit n=1 Tax=Paenibacillus rhizophilus TaxID=1850366 RepID=A0A3N9Q3N8_9BACL|nr:Clp protease ClpP [Paenibacillus rhizophilus]
MAKVTIKGVIVSNDDYEIYQWFGIEAVSPNQVAEQISSANGEALEVDINSGGGDVYAGSEIYTALKEYKGDVTTRIVGVAASAASVAAMGGRKVMISPTAQMMIHNVSSVSRGDYRDHQHESDVIKNYNKSIANAYILKSGLSEAEILDLMDKESWFTAQQALEKGLVDEIMFDNSLKLSASLGASGMLPPEVINRIRNELVKAKNAKNEEQHEPERTPQAPLSLLQRKMNLKGRVLTR